MHPPGERLPANGPSSCCSLSCCSIATKSMHCASSMSWYFPWQPRRPDHFGPRSWVVTPGVKTLRVCALSLRAGLCLACLAWRAWRAWPGWPGWPGPPSLACSCWILAWPGLAWPAAAAATAASAWPGLVWPAAALRCCEPHILGLAECQVYFIYVWTAFFMALLMLNA